MGIEKEIEVIVRCLVDAGKPFTKFDVIKHIRENSNFTSAKYYTNKASIEAEIAKYNDKLNCELKDYNGVQAYTFTKKKIVAAQPVTPNTSNITSLALGINRDGSITVPKSITSLYGTKRISFRSALDSREFAIDNYGNVKLSASFVRSLSDDHDQVVLRAKSDHILIEPNKTVSTNNGTYVYQIPATITDKVGSFTVAPATAPTVKVTWNR